MASFSVPYVAPNANSWGPPSEEDASNPNAPVSKFTVLPYAPFGRSDRLGRAADFTGRHQYQYNRGGGNRRGGDDNSEFQYKINAEEESSFQLVDTSKAATNNARRFVTPAARRRQHTQKLRQVNARRQQQSNNQGATANLQAQQQRTRGGRGGGRYGGRGGRHYAPRIDRQASVSVQPDWVQVEEMDLAKLTKKLDTSTEVPTANDLLWCGFLDQYNDAYDKVAARAPAPLKKNETKEFYPVTTTDDPVLEKLAVDGNSGNVFITDAILAHLMTCTRSVYPWDIVIQKLPGGTLFFDKRDNSQFDYLTVYETAHSPPTNGNNNNNNNNNSKDDDPDGINTPERLGLEATIIHQNFSQQILKSNKGGTNVRQEMQLPNPFFDEEDNDGMEPASVAYRYRQFDLGEDVQLVCRTELHGTVKNKDTYMTAFCLNEYPTAGTIAWRDRLDAQRGAVLATELKNNSFKLAKWTASSLLAGADQMKIGFVSRTAPKNAYEHVILGTQFYRPKDFATQITLKEGQMWAMIRMFIQLLRKQPDDFGKYVLMRDPNKAVLRLFKVPPNTFDDEDEEEEEEEEKEE
jgi:translation initiation factor 3 subunit D